MKKIALFLSLLILVAVFSGCSCSLKFGSGSNDSDSTKTEIVYEDHDSAMEILAEQYMELLESKAELTILVAESDDTEAIFEYFDKIEEQTATTVKTLEYLEGENEKMFAQATLNTILNTAYADETNSYGVDTGLRDYGLMRSIGNFLTKDQYRDQDEAMRMGIYTAYKEIEKASPSDAETLIAPRLAELGINDIEEIFYTDLANVEEFYNKEVDQLPEGYGSGFQSYKQEMYETLREGDANDMYNYIDNVTAIISDEIEEGEYGEYVPKHIADFMIRTNGYAEFQGYIDQRRENKLALENEVVDPDDFEEPSLYDFFNDQENDDYYGEGYDPEDDDEVIIAYNEETGELIIVPVNTDDTNSINLPEGDYKIYATADGNLPVSAEDVSIVNGGTTTVHNTTVKNVEIDQDLLAFIVSLGQAHLTLPTKSELTEKQEELERNIQMKAYLEQQLEILKSMEGGTFTTVSPEARDKLNNQLSEANKAITSLEEELSGYEVFTDIIGDREDGEDGEYAEFITASGSWNGMDSGSISVEFASDGGPVTAYFSGCPGGTCWSSTATGYYDGGEGGAVSGNVDGYMEASEYIEARNIFGSFSGNIYLKEEYASGTFSLSVGPYGDSGSWSVSFDNGLED
ncbi:MAG: carboxypeptidase-like regulatory domain-containing protein [Nitrospirota bacterium]